MTTKGSGRWMAGQAKRWVRKRLGHSSITVTMDRYGHLLPALEEQLTEDLDRAWTQIP